MNKNYYSVEEIATLLDMHPKTIARYIREGKLKANKVGKAWRVSGHDLSVFAEGKQDELPSTKIPSVSVSSVVDMEAISKEQAVRIANTLTAAANSKDATMGKASVSTQYIEQAYKLRIMLWGTPAFTEVMMGTISALTEEQR